MFFELSQTIDCRKKLLTNQQSTMNGVIYETF